MEIARSLPRSAGSRGGGYNDASGSVNCAGLTVTIEVPIEENDFAAVTVEVAWKRD